MVELQAKILLVEDDFNFGNVLKSYLEMNGLRKIDEKNICL